MSLVLFYTNLEVYTIIGTVSRQDWNMIHAQLAVYFAERMGD